MQISINRNILIFIASGLIVLLSSCGAKDSSVQSEPVKTPSVSVEKTVPQIHEKKPGANITLLSSNKLASELNQVSTDIISVNLPRDKTWELKLTSDTEVEIQSDTQMYIPVVDENTLPVRSAFDIPIRWIAKQSGRYYLHLHFSHQGSESVEARDIGLILEVNDKSLPVKASSALQKQAIEKKSSSLSSDSSNIIELPAEEKIRAKK